MCVINCLTVICYVCVVFLSELTVEDQRWSEACERDAGFKRKSPVNIMETQKNKLFFAEFN